ncbi:hypothetical protein [Qipengyuania qiaonensis]|uniref:Methyl-accepting transducer domain-containing protein n=1 Tax=Qipengyuania qiaonensis TaxID=2867240 RepID=A0ABS7J775_9SPHN|nr:hypothetical protein [Qipengyuania qiaonensis]MBX7482793.1 hypothetical protein [Qipengyuania qiaonensis]
MHEIETAAGRVVANDTQKSIDAVDQAVMSIAHLCASIVEVSKASRLPVGTAQGALSMAGTGLTNAIESHEDIGRATRELIKIQKASNLETVGFGCPPLHEPSARTDGKVFANRAA